MAAAIGFGLLFAWRFDLGLRVALLHVGVTSAILAATYPSLALVGRRWHAERRTLVEALVALTLSAGTLFFAILYASVWASNTLWGKNVSWHLFQFYVLRLHALEQVAAPVSWWLVSAVIVLAVLAATPYVALRRRIVAGLTELSARRTAALALGLGIVAALITISVLASASIGVPRNAPDRSELTEYHRRQLIHREPLLGLFANKHAVSSLVDFLTARRLAVSEPQIRAGYAGAASPAARANVVLIVVDSLRADHMGVYGYPRPTTPYLQSLAETGELTAVAQTLANCPESLCGIASLLSSRTFASETPENFKLHELLFDQGYEVHFVHAGDHAWYGLRDFYGDSLTSYSDGREPSPYPTTDDRRVLDRLRALPPMGSDPTFFYLHLMSTHQAATRLVPYRIYLPAPGDAWARDHGGRELEYRINTYDNGVLQADAMIEQALGRLEAGGYLDNAVVMIVSDHGEGLGERGTGGWGHSSALSQPALAIPWLILDSADTAYRNLDFALQVDVAATIVDRLGLPIPSSWEGRSLLAPPAPRVGYLRTGSEDASYGVVQTTAHGRVYKYLRYSDAALRTLQHRGWRSGEVLYELTTDPSEETNLIDTSDPQLVESLRRRLELRAGS